MFKLYPYFLENHTRFQTEIEVYFQYSIHETSGVQRLMGLIIKSMAD